jgi:predicted DNA-binding protein (MmcQ/YjbR family)
MAHPLMFEDGDPLLARLRRIALQLPGADEKVSHGRPTFYTSKVFAYYGGSTKVGGGWVQHPRSLLVLPDPTERRALVEEPRCYLPAYLAPSGWIGIDLDDDIDWSEVSELVDASYRLTAGRRLVAELDAEVAARDSTGSGQ